MARSKYTRWLALATALIGAVAIGIALFPHQRLLLERASKVANVGDWWSPETQVYVWLSETILFIGTYLWSNSRWGLENPFLYDVRAHSRTPLSRLSELLKRDSDTGRNDWKISPDGKWLLWTNVLRRDVRVARLDGSGFQIVPLPHPGIRVIKISWHDQKGHWIAEGFDNASGKLTNVFGGDATKPELPRSMPLSEGKMFFDGKALQVAMKANSVVVRLADGDENTHLKSKSTTLYPPNNAQIVEVVKSTRGDRLAWILLSTNTPPLAQWLRSVFPRYAAPHTFAAIWVSGLHGSEMHEVGHVMLGSDADETPNHLEWLPSDSRVSFLYKDALWTVPVD